MKRIMIATIALMLAACADPGVSTSSYNDIIKNEPGLAGCRVYTVHNGSGQMIHIVRCTDSVTTAQWKSGKTTMESVTIDEKIDEAAARESARLNGLSKLTEAEKQALGLIQ